MGKPSFLVVLACYFGVILWGSAFCYATTGTEVAGNDAASGQTCVANVPQWRQTNLCQKNLVIFAHDTEFYGSLTVKKKFFVTLLDGEEVELGEKIAQMEAENDELVAQNEQLMRELAEVKGMCLAVKAKQDEIYQPPTPPPPSNLVTPIPDASWHTFVSECLSEVGAEVTGECTTWASANNYGTMPNWDTSLVTDMRGYDQGDPGNMMDMGVNIGFGGKSTFNGNIMNWNTAQVTSMYSMFRSASAFNQDIGSWNTDRVTNMEGMFSEASAFNQDIGNWNTAVVSRMQHMFTHAVAFNQNIGAWVTDSVENMEFMFYGASAFNQDIGSWNTDRVSSMAYMFDSASAFNQDISSWTGTAATTTQTNMFSGATAFQAKYTCEIHGPASSCDTIKSTWVAPSPPPPPTTSP